MTHEEMESLTATTKPVGGAVVCIALTPIESSSMLQEVFLEHSLCPVVGFRNVSNQLKILKPVGGSVPFIFLY